MAEPQRYYHYTLWEDFNAGMWMPPRAGDAGKAQHILSDPEIFRSAAVDMLNAWPVAAEHNLTNLGINRQAWIGQATCCHLAGVPESATREGWWLLSDEEKAAANAVADECIAAWERARDLTRQPTLFDGS